jgi:hypoxanthine phosphoribosyltransferase
MSDVRSFDSYFSIIWQNPDKLLNAAEQELSRIDYDTMVGTGLSGSLVIPMLARHLGKYWAIVRKNEPSHSSNPIEGRIGRKWIFVDDFVSSGKTRNTVQNAMRADADSERQWNYDKGDYRSAAWQTEYIGTYSYKWSEFSI